MVGKVYLVGAGPGDPELLTLKGLRCLQQADVVVYDRLVDQRILEHAPRQAEIIDVGKARGNRRMGQDLLNALLVELASQDKQVVRLKGGDPFVFGRGGEEAMALAEAGIPFEVVSGVTSAVAVPAYAGIPLTHRQMTSSFIVVSGSEDPGKEESLVDWESLASSKSTLVVLMGWEALPRIVETLLAHGRSPSTPVAVIRWGTEPHQQTVTGTLSDIVAKGQEADLSPPVVAVIGEVVSLRDNLRWFDNRPLFGKRVLVTRSRAQASVLSHLLAQQGAQPIELPTIEIGLQESFTLLDEALGKLSSYHWIVFTSVNGVEALFQRLHHLSKDTRTLASVQVCAIGSATAAALEAQGLRADLVPQEFTSTRVVDAFGRIDLSGKRMLLPRADMAGSALPQGLRDLGALVDDISVYRTLTPEESRGSAHTLLTEGVDIATFTSSSTVRNLLSLLDGETGLLDGACIACIGPVTAETAREMGLHVDVVAGEHTIPGLVEALSHHFA